MTKLNIILENNDRAVYFAGQVLKGTIELHLNEPKKVTGLYFILSGISNCHWTRKEKSFWEKNSHTVYYEGERIHMNIKTYLFGARGANSVEIAAGTHRYSFEFQLPLTLPESFEASRGHIRYSIEACLDIPWRFDKETKLKLTILRKDDLNECPGLRNPNKLEQTKRFCDFCCFCGICRSEPLTATMTLPCIGFTPGQTIPITIQYNNMSDTRVTGTNINLKRVTTFNCYTPRHDTKWESHKMAKAKNHEEVRAKTSKTFKLNFVLPKTLVNSNGRFCNVVQVSYNLHVEVQLSGCSKNFEMVFPIVIGSVPINFNQTNNNVPLQMPMQIPYTDFTNGPMHSAPMPYNAFTNVPMPSAPMPYSDFTNGPMPSAPMPYNDCTKPTAEQLPPSFEEAVKMKPKKDDSIKLNNPPEKNSSDFCGQSFDVWD